MYCNEIANGCVDLLEVGFMGSFSRILVALEKIII